MEVKKILRNGFSLCMCRDRLSLTRRVGGQHDWIDFHSEKVKYCQ